MNSPPKTNFNTLMQKSPVFSNLMKKFINELTYHYKNFDEIKEKQIKFLENKRSSIGTYEKVMQDLQEYMDQKKITIEIPDEYKGYIKKNIEELNSTYSRAIIILKKGPKKDGIKGFLNDYPEHLKGIKDFLKDPDKNIGKYIGPAEILWNNNVAGHQNRQETIDSNYLADVLHQTTMLKVYFLTDDLAKQIVFQEMIPHRLETVKYACIIAEKAAKYGFNLTENDALYIGEIYAGLAKNPRGVGKTGLYPWANLFHNASNHSAGTLDIGMRIIDESFKNLLKKESKSNHTHLKQVNNEFKDRMAFALISHDIGEEHLRETLVQGEVKKLKDKELRGKLGKARDVFEDFSARRYTVPKTSKNIKEFNLSDIEISECEKKIVESLTLYPGFESHYKEVLEKSHTSPDIIRLMKDANNKELASEILLKFSYTAKYLYGVKMDLPDGFSEDIPQEEKIKTIENILLNAKSEYKESLIGQINISEGHSQLETQTLRKIYKENVLTVEREHDHYIRKIGKIYEINDDVIEKFLENMKTVNKEHLKNKFTRDTHG